MFKSLRKPREFYKSFFAMAVPVMLQNLIGSSLGLVDTFMVGTLGQNELGGLSIANTPFFVAMLFVFGLQSGGAVLMSQYWGKRDIPTINRVLGITWMFAVGASFIFATIVFIFPRAVMGLITNNEAQLEVAVRYGRIVAYSYVLNSFTSIYIGARRSCESPQLGTAVVIIGMGSNVVFNYIFIFGKLGFAPMGVEGAALGTLMARVVELIVVVAYMAVTQRKPNQVLRLMPSRIFRPGLTIMKDFLRYASPVMLNETLWGLGFSMYTVIFGHMATSGDVVPAYAVARNIEQIATVAMMAVANATAVLVGKAVGAGESKEEVFSLSRTFITIAMLSGLASGLILLIVLFTILRPFVYPAFDLTDGAQRACTIILTLQGIFCLFRSFSSTLVVGVLRGGGDVNFGLFLDVSAMWLFAIPLGAIAGLVLGLDILWVYLIIMSEELIKFILGMIRFRGGKWIRNVTRDNVA